MQRYYRCETHVLAARLVTRIAVQLCRPDGPPIYVTTARSTFESVAASDLADHKLVAPVMCERLNARLDQDCPETCVPSTLRLFYDILTAFPIGSIDASVTDRVLTKMIEKTNISEGKDTAFLMYVALGTPIASDAARLIAAAPPDEIYPGQLSPGRLLALMDRLQAAPVDLLQQIPPVELLSAALKSLEEHGKRPYALIRVLGRYLRRVDAAGLLKVADLPQAEHEAIVQCTRRWLPGCSNAETLDCFAGLGLVDEDTQAAITMDLAKEIEVMSIMDLHSFIVSPSGKEPDTDLLDSVSQVVRFGPYGDRPGELNLDLACRVLAASCVSRQTTDTNAVAKDACDAFCADIEKSSDDMLCVHFDILLRYAMLSKDPHAIRALQIACDRASAVGVEELSPMQAARLTSLRDARLDAHVEGLITECARSAFSRPECELIIRSGSKFADPLAKARLAELPQRYTGPALAKHAK